MLIGALRAVLQVPDPIPWMSANATRRSAIVVGPRDALCQWKLYRLLQNCTQIPHVAMIGQRAPIIAKLVKFAVSCPTRDEGILIWCKWAWYNTQ